MSTLSNVTDALASFAIANTIVSITSVRNVCGQLPLLCTRMSMFAISNPEYALRRCLPP